MTRYDLDLWPVDLESLWLVWCHVVIVCAKFDRNRTIPGWVIQNFANFGPCYVTLWPWPLIPWPWTYMVDGALCGQSMFQIWARSHQPRLSYWRLTTDFSSALGGAPILPEVIWKTRGPICTKPGGDIVRSSLNTKLKNGEDIFLGFQTTAAQNRALVSNKAKNHTFWPPVKIRGGVDEMSGSILVASPMIEPLVHICRPASPRLLRNVFG